MCYKTNANHAVLVKIKCIFLCFVTLTCNLQNVSAFSPVTTSINSFQTVRLSNAFYRTKTTVLSMVESQPETANEDSMRNKVMKLAKSVSGKRSRTDAATPQPQAIGAILRDAAEGAADEIRKSSYLPGNGTDSESTPTINPTDANRNMEVAFASAEAVLDKAQSTLDELRATLASAKLEALNAISEAEGAVKSATTAIPVEFPATVNELGDKVSLSDVDDLSYDDVDYEMAEMAPPFIGEDMCLVPGVPLVRVEKAPENSRRIFAGIDILAGVEDVWKILTDYENLQQVVPNLVINEVLKAYPGDPDTHTFDFHENPKIPSEIQCKELTQKLKGATLRQVGGAKVVGINFSARTTLEVREWPEGMPDFAHFNDDIYQGDSRAKRVADSKGVPLQRYKFPRPFAMSKLPTKDISMQSVENDDGEFRVYQGVWRMQPLPGCSAPGTSAMRLTYAVEISPRAYLPVRLVEGRIAQDLCANLEAIRDFVTKTE